MVTWYWNATTGDMQADSLCGLCGEVAVGMASIDNMPYCHGQGRDCYQTASHAMARRGRPDEAVPFGEFLDSLPDDEDE